MLSTVVYDVSKVLNQVQQKLCSSKLWKVWHLMTFSLRFIFSFTAVRPHCKQTKAAAAQSLVVNSAVAMMSWMFSLAAMEILLWLSWKPVVLVFKGRLL